MGRDGFEENFNLVFNRCGLSSGQHGYQRGGSGTPSYKQVVVDKGKGPRGVGFKELLTDTSRSGSKKNQEGNQKKSDRVGEEAREAHNNTQEMTNPSGVDGHNPCKPKTTLMPKVILEDPQTQLYRDQMKMHSLICNFMGMWPIEKTLCS
jgi:hypothetical protein